jgi:hypothetical protein
VTVTEYITLAQATKLIPGRPHVATAWRWGTHGVRGVKLQTIRSGSKVLTTPAWVEEFNLACNQTTEERAKAELLADGC